MIENILRAALGLLFFCVVAWLMSSARRQVPWRVIGCGLALQFGLAWVILGTSHGTEVLAAISDGFAHVIGMANVGAKLVFGPLADRPKMVEVFGERHATVLAFAGNGLVAIIFFSALMAILYHIGVMQLVIYAMARVMSALMKVSGAESLAAAANVFVGQTEAPLVVKPYLERMTPSELNALMTGGFATIAGSVLAVYMGILGPEYGPHLMSASVMSAPAAFLIAKIMLPETQDTVTGGNVKFRVERSAGNLLEAAANGTSDGLKLWLNVIAMLIAFTALIALVNWPLGVLGEWMNVGGVLSLERIFGWVFSPVAFLMGVEGWHDCELCGSLLGTKIAVNEFVAFSQLGELLATDGSFEHARSAKMMAYALCGFANFASIGIQIGGISPIAPTRKRELSELAPRAMLGGAMASWMTATIAGLFIS